ncbi:MAG: DNA polymerase III subunit gamma/tau [Bacteroidota bacterium]|nr:DNA polymerase III subunit gamma/tau [Bacteroidota bacterium]
MKNFVVSARKYRPASFDTVVGQSVITNTLKNAIKNQHLAQAFLFCGPRGVGKTSCARILAKTINCLNPKDSIEACDECESCLSFNNNHSFNIHELDAASNNGVDKIRELVDQVRFAPQVGQYSIYIIDEVHMLSQAAFNAFLKTLEEPPAHAIFILATTEKHKIIPTILSRCQIFDFKRIQIQDIAQHLSFVAKSEGIDAEEDALHMIAQKADGALRDALSIFDQIVSFSGTTLSYKDVIDNLNILDEDYYFKMTDAMQNHDIASVLNLFNDILNNGFDGQHFVNGLAMHFRNLMVAKDNQTLSLLEVGQTIKKRILEQSSSWDHADIIYILELLNKADINYKSSKNQRLLVEFTLMQLCNISEPSTKKKIVVRQDSKQAKVENREVAPNLTQEIPQTKPKSEKIEANSIKIIDFKEDIQKKTISINIHRTKESKENEVEKIKPVERNTPFQEKDLQNQVSKYSNQKQKEGKFNLSSILNKKKIIMDNDYQLTLTLDNKVQEEVLQNEKNSFVAFLKEQLCNDLISLQLVVLPLKKEEQKAYSDEDRFKKMAEKQPLLNEMKSKFKLEIDY